MIKDIQPTTDEHGVGWCSGLCQQHMGLRGCRINVEATSGVCLPWARRIVAENAELRRKLDAAMSACANESASCKGFKRKEEE